MRIDDLGQLIQSTIVQTAVQAAATQSPAIAAMRNSPAPDDSGYSGYFEDDPDTGVLTFHRWFRVGNPVGSRTLRPY